MKRENKIKFKKNLNNKSLLISRMQEKNSKEFKACCLGTAAILAISMTLTLAPKRAYTNPGVGPQTNFVVAHAGGAIESEGDVLKYLNCVEGFYKFYNEGTRMFEYDMAFTSDEKLVGTHKFEYHKNFSFKNRISYDEYNSVKIAGKFTGLNEELLLSLVENFPDCKFIIDTKEENPTSVYERIIKLSNEKDIDIKSGILPFVSSKEMLEEINKKYDFKEIMFTNYKAYYNSKKLLNIIKDCSKIKYLHIFPIDFFRIDIDSINKTGVRVFAHMDKNNKARTALDYGCTGIFSDDISENEFKQNHYGFLMEKLNDKQNEVAIKRKQNSYNREPDFSF